MDKNYVAKEDAVLPDVNKSISGSVAVRDFNPAYEQVSYGETTQELTAPCGVCFSPVVIDRADKGTFHLCEDCRRAILFLKYRRNELDELICKSKR